MEEDDTLEATVKGAFVASKGAGAAATGDETNDVHMEVTATAAAAEAGAMVVRVEVRNLLCSGLLG